MTGILNLLAGAVGVVKDTYFNLVTLLLPGNGTNGAQNNTFLDSSSNNFTITRNGNTTQGTFSPFSQTGWGNFFGGTLSYFTAPSNAAFNMGAGDFTVELFAYDVARNSSGTIWVSKWGSTASVGRSFVLGYMSSTNELFLYGSSDGTTQTNIISTTSHGLNLNTWNHIAATRSGNTFRLFVNGSLVATATNSITLYSSTTPFCVGANYEDVQSSLSNFNVNGYISNLRILKGTAQYTSAFTPPVSPLTAITNTSLLTCQSNRFIDNSSNAFAITVNGTPSVQAFSPFAPTAAYSADTVGGSGYFDGTGDYLSVADSAALEVGSSSFTVEAWVYLSAANQANGSAIISKAATTSYSPFTLALSPTGYLQFYCSTAGSTWNVQVTDTTVFPLNTWVHVAGVRNGTTFTLYRNGVSVGTPVTLSGALWDNTETLKIGWLNFANTSWTGYISSTRLVIGTAVYTAAFTPPTAPLTAITNTSLLLNFTNAGITDATAKNDLETVGNAQISTTQSKFGGSSIAVTGGTANYLVSPNINMYTLYGAFTIEAWVYRNTSTSRLILIEGRTAGGYANYLVGILTNGTLEFVTSNSANYYNPSSTITNGQWVHVALVRNTSNVVTLYVNGVAASTTVTVSGVLTPAASSVWLGAQRDPQYSDGYIDDFRITQFARYTSNFTPPTAAFPVQ